MNDHSLFTLKRGQEFIALVVYVDDIIITGTSPTMIDEVKSYIHQRFKIKDQGFLKYFLGLEVVMSRIYTFI